MRNVILSRCSFLNWLFLDFLDLICIMMLLLQGSFSLSSEFTF